VFDNGGWFNMAKITPQLIGIATAFGWVFVTAFILFKVLSMTVGLRASKAEELEGMDMAEHGNEAYPDFAPHTPGLHLGGGKSKPGAAPVPAGAAMATDA
jgi:Amt family ammonium transporter